MKTWKNVFSVAPVVLVFLVFLSPLIVGVANMDFGEMVREEIQVTGWKTCCPELSGSFERFSTLIIAKSKPQFLVGNYRGAMNLPLAATVHEFSIRGNRLHIKVGQKVTVSLTCISRRVVPSLHFMDDQVCTIDKVDEVAET